MRGDGLINRSNVGQIEQSGDGMRIEKGEKGYLCWGERKIWPGFASLESANEIISLYPDVRGVFCCLFTLSSGLFHIFSHPI